MQLRPNAESGKFAKGSLKGLIAVGVLVIVFVAINKIIYKSKPTPDLPRALLINHGPDGIDTIDISGWDSLKMDSFIRATRTYPVSREEDSMYKAYKLDELDSLMNLPNTPSEDSLLMRFEQMQKAARK